MIVEPKGPTKLTRRLSLAYGGRGLGKKMTKCDIGRGGLSQRVMSLLQNYIVSKIPF